MDQKKVLRALRTRGPQIVNNKKQTIKNNQGVMPKMGWMCETLRKQYSNIYIDPISDQALWMLGPKRVPYGTPLWANRALLSWFGPIVNRALGPVLQLATQYTVSVCHAWTASEEWWLLPLQRSRLREPADGYGVTARHKKVNVHTKTLLRPQIA